MGIWNETCAVTHFPISYQDPVFVILLEPGKADELGRLNYHGNWWCSRYDNIYDVIQLAAYGTYNLYGWINELPKMDADDPFSNARCDFRSVFVHKKVMDKIIELYPDNAAAADQMRQINKLLHGENSKNIEYLEDVLALSRFAMDCRLDLNVGFNYKGCQHYPTHYQLLVDMMSEQLQNHEQEGHEEGYSNKSKDKGE